MRSSKLFLADLVRLIDWEISLSPFAINMRPLSHAGFLELKQRTKCWCFFHSPGLICACQKTPFFCEHTYTHTHTLYFTYSSAEAKFWRPSSQKRCSCRFASSSWRHHRQAFAEEICNPRTSFYRFNKVRLMLTC